MNWIDDVERELGRAAESERIGNRGRARTSARRAAGIAVSELQGRFPERFYGRDFIGQLRAFADDPTIPTIVRAAAERLQARLSPEFESPSENPVEDARIIFHYVRERLL